MTRDGDFYQLLKLFFPTATMIVPGMIELARHDVRFVETAILSQPPRR